MTTPTQRTRPTVGAVHTAGATNIRQRVDTGSAIEPHLIEKETKMYAAIATPPESQHDLGLTPRDYSRMAQDFHTDLRTICTGGELPRTGIWSEVSKALRERTRLGSGDANSMLIPTGAPIWRAWRADQLARLKIQQRDALTTGSGGYLVATDNISFIEMLRNRMVAFAMGATRMSGLVGNVTVPKQTVGATAYWLASETTDITEGNQTFAQLALTPRTVAAYTQISRLLQLQSAPDAQQVIMNDLARQVALAADAAVLNGTGTEQPTGILNTASIGTFTGGSLDTAALLNAQTDVATANALTSTSGYVTTPAVATLLMARQRFAGPTGDALWQGSVLDGQVLGMKAMSSGQCPTATMIFGDWAQVVIGEWSVLELTVNPFDDFAKGLTGLRCMWTCDVGVRHAGAFSVATSIT